jgi:hypothetical protein
MEVRKAIVGLATLGLGIAISASSPAYARQGCGRGWHRGAYGRCVPNRRPLVYAPVAPVLVVDRFYPGRGYWDGRRYWWHRERWHHHWRYR